MKIVSRLLNGLLKHTKGLFSKKPNIEVNVHELLNIVSFPSHIEKINCKSKIELIKLLEDISKNKLNSTFIAQDLAKILNVNNYPINVKGLINLLKREHNRKAIFNLLRIDNEYITTEEGLRQFTLRNIKVNKLPSTENITTIDISTSYHVKKYNKIFNFLMSKKYHKFFNYAIRCDITSVILYYIDIDLKDNKDQTLLHHAVKLGNLKIVEKLISKGVKLNCIDQNGCTPLNLALKSRNVEITNLLLDKKAEYNCTHMGNRVLAEEDFEFLWPLAKNKGLVLKSEQSSGPSVNQLNTKSTNHYSDTVSQQASNTNLLLSKKGKEQTPLHHAVGLEDLEMVKRLISKGAKLNCIDQNGCTPLNLAIKSRNVEITNLLLDAYADIKYTYSPNKGNIIQIYTKEDYEFFIPLLSKRSNPWVMQEKPNATLQQVRNANLIQMISSV